MLIETVDLSDPVAIGAILREKKVPLDPLCILDKKTFLLHYVDGTRIYSMKGLIDCEPLSLPHELQSHITTLDLQMHVPFHSVFKTESGELINENGTPYTLEEVQNPNWLQALTTLIFS